MQYKANRTMGFSMTRKLTLKFLHDPSAPNEQHEKYYPILLKKNGVTYKIYIPNEFIEDIPAWSLLELNKESMGSLPENYHIQTAAEDSLTHR